MRRPSTLVSSCSGSALVPSVLTVWPFPSTRPCVINSSAARRDATPAAEMIFWRRSSLIEQLRPEVYQPPDRRRARRLVHLSMGDERRQQDVHGNAPRGQIPREQRGLDRRDDVVVRAVQQ